MSATVSRDPKGERSAIARQAHNPCNPQSSLGLLEGRSLPGRALAVKMERTAFVRF
jgi:hypothetical protein